MSARSRSVCQRRDLDRLAYKSTIVAFPLFGAGIILARSGPSGLGTLLGLGPQGTVSFIAWVIYAAVPARPRHVGLARHQGGLDQRRRLRRVLFNLFIYQHGGLGSALLRGSHLIYPARVRDPGKRGVEKAKGIGRCETAADSFCCVLAWPRRRDRWGYPLPGRSEWRRWFLAVHAPQELGVVVGTDSPTAPAAPACRGGGVGAERLPEQDRKRHQTDERQ